MAFILIVVGLVFLVVLLLSRTGQPASTMTSDDDSAVPFTSDVSSPDGHRHTADCGHSRDGGGGDSGSDGGSD